MNPQHIRLTVSLVLAVASVAAAIIILFSSADVVTTEWFSGQTRPPVLLAICSVVTNAMLHVTLSEILPIRWWLISRSTPAQKPNAAEKLTQTFDQGTGLLAALKGLASFRLNHAAVAYLCVAIAAVNGPLFQRASRVQADGRNSTVTLTTMLATTPPIGFSGWEAAKGRNTVLLTSKFSRVVRAFAEKDAIFMRNTGCRGVCDTFVEAMGFKVECKNATYDYDLENIQIGEDGRLMGILSTTAFNTSVDMGIRDVSPDVVSTGYAAYLNVNTAFKDSPALVGKGTTRSCTLEPATVRYKIRLVNATVTLFGNMTSDEIVSTRPVDAISSTYGEGAMSRQTLGGVALWARERFSSSAYISYNPTSDTDLQEPKGTLLHDFAEAEFVNRSTTWADPTDYILNGIREVMFRSAIEFNDNLQPVKVTAENILDVLEYKTNMLFLALGVAASVIGCLGVLPLMWGFWRLDEDVNLNPSRCADAVLAVSEEKQAGVDGTQVTVGDGEKAVTYTAVDSKHQ